MEIKTYEELGEKSLASLREIFFLSSSVQKFESEAKREDFFERWLGLYLKHYPQYAYLAVAEGRVLGYLVLWPQTEEFLDLRPLESLKLFSDFYRAYPAHLHMNTHPDARGKGVGSALLAHAFGTAEAIHLLTSPGQRNVEFYLRHGFKTLASRSFKGSELMLMAWSKSL